MVKALLFDLDGTLADTDPLHLLAWREALRPYGLEVDLGFYRKRISGRLNPEIVQDLLSLEGEEARRLIEAKEARFRDLAKDLKPTPGLLEFLDLIQKKGYAGAWSPTPPRKTPAMCWAPWGWTRPSSSWRRRWAGASPTPSPTRWP